MTDPAGAATTAFQVAERLRGRLPGPWDVYGERIRRYEVHLNGRSVEMVRGPIQLEGYGLRLFRSVEGSLGSGFSSTSDLSDAGVNETIATAESAARFSRLPTKGVELPRKGTGHLPEVATVDVRLWAKPEESLMEFVHGLFGAFDGRRTETPSFGSLRATLCEATIANSEGFEGGYRHTLVDLEVAVKATGGAEGAPPGEYWVNERSRRLPSEHLAHDVEDWCRKAQDVRRASAPPTGDLTVVFPTRVLADVLPSIVGFRLCGAAQVRKMSPEVGASVGSSVISVSDDGLLPLGVGSAPIDDEGSPQGRRSLVEHGAVSGLLQDVVFGSAAGGASTGNGRRDSVEYSPWFHFTRTPSPGPTNLVIAPGDGGTDEELVEGVQDGILLDQLGYAFPDPFSGIFGGEIRIGYRIRHGKIAEPIRGGTVGGAVLGSGDAPSVFGQAKAVGSRPLTAGYLSSPAIRVDGFPVAGG